MRTKNTKLFSMVELLVVVAIIMALISLLNPALKKMHDSAKSLLCQNNFKIIGIGNTEFAADNDDHNVGGGYRMAGSGGSVFWGTILTKTSMAGMGKSIIKYNSTENTDMNKTLGCTNAEPVKRYGRLIGMNGELVGTHWLAPQYHHVVEDKSLWPGSAYQGDLRARYWLGARHSEIAYPSRLVLLSDTDSLNVDSFTRLSYADLSNSDWQYNKIGQINFRHGGGYLASQLFSDLHSELIEPFASSFGNDRMKVRPND